MNFRPNRTCCVKGREELNQMMAPGASSAVIPYSFFQGLKIPETAVLEYFQSALSYTPKAGDVFIVSHPKCGTTWIQHIVYLIFNKGKPAKDVSEVISAIPYVEQDGFPQTTNCRTLALKYHVPFNWIPFSEEAKYICITRNPKDTCVSYYHFLKNLPSYDIPSFDYFFESFVQGELPYGDYFDHLLSWYEQKHRENVLFLTYESIQANHKEVVLHVARFLGQESSLDDDMISDIVKHSSLSFMKKLVDGGSTMKRYLNGEWSINSSREHTSLESKDSTKTVKKPVMIRKGMVGDWANYFSEEQDSKMDYMFFEKTKGTDIHLLWPGTFSTPKRDSSDADVGAA